MFQNLEQRKYPPQLSAKLIRSRQTSYESQDTIPNQTSPIVYPEKTVDKEYVPVDCLPKASCPLDFPFSNTSEAE